MSHLSNEQQELWKEIAARAVQGFTSGGDTDFDGIDIVVLSARIADEICKAYKERQQNGLPK